MAHVFNPKNKEKLDNPKRRELLPPELLLDAVGFQPGTVVADIGCGIGYFSVPAAERVGPDGTVYGIDISPEMLEDLNVRAEAAGCTNVEGLLAENGVLPLPADSTDVALLCLVLHEVGEPAGMLKEIVRILRPGGRLAVLDWKREESDWGPPADHRLAAEDVLALLNENGFKADAARDVNGYHYLIVAERQ